MNRDVMQTADVAARAALEALHLKHDMTQEVRYELGWAIIVRRCSCGRLTETERQATDQAMIRVADGSMDLRRMQVR